MMVEDNKDITILSIESSCDDTSAAILVNNVVVSNEIARQHIHEKYGGVVPELASRAHQQNIVPVVDVALKNAKKTLEDIDAIAYTRGPGLMGSLLVGVSFAKGLSQALEVPLLDVNHMQAHVLAHFALKPEEKRSLPQFPFLCLTVSGGHTQIVLIKDHLDMSLIGSTRDDAAGEAFDKAAKLMGVPYPGGPLIDKYAKEGDPLKYRFPKGKVDGYDYSFSGLKTSILYFLQKNPELIETNLNDLCASIQYTIVSSLMAKLKKAAKDFGINEVAIAGGVSANSYLRTSLVEAGKELGWNVHIPDFQFCTDNAAMIGVAGYYQYLNGEFGQLSDKAVARAPISLK